MKLENRRDIKRKILDCGLTVTRMAVELETSPMVIYNALSKGTSSERVTNYLEKIFGAPLEKISDAWRKTI